MGDVLEKGSSRDMFDGGRKEPATGERRGSSATGVLGPREENSESSSSERSGDDSLATDDPSYEQA